MSLSRILGKPQGSHSFAGDSRWVLPSCMMGWEFEYEGVEDRVLPRHTFSGFWTYHEEGSLRDSGAEFVFTNPIFGVDAYNALRWLTEHAVASKWKCTKRTGIHAHVDVRDMEAPQLVGMCVLYAILEPILYKWIGGGRENSHFCLPLYRADQALLGTCNILSAALMDHRTDSHSTLILAETFQRYAGFNLNALAKFGSVEFRHMQTTHDLERIVDWGNMLLSLKAAAFKLPQSDGAAIRMLTHMGVRELLDYVFPPSLAAKLYTFESARLFNQYGIPSARDIAVHSCGPDDWLTNTYPKGKTTGFNKWCKENSKVKKPVEQVLHVDQDMAGVNRLMAQFEAVARPRVAIDEFELPQEDDILVGRAVGLQEARWGVPPAAMEGVAARARDPIQRAPRAPANANLPQLLRPRRR